jgi:ribosomal protein S20
LAIESGNVEQAQAATQLATKALDKAAAKGVFIRIKPHAKKAV